MKWFAALRDWWRTYAYWQQEDRAYRQWQRRMREATA